MPDAVPVHCHLDDAIAGVLFFIFLNPKVFCRVAAGLSTSAFGNKTIAITLKLGNVRTDSILHLTPDNNEH